MSKYSDSIAQLLDSLRAAKSFKDPNLSAEGHDRHRAYLRQTAFAKAHAVIDGEVTAAQSRVKRTQEALAKALRPSTDAGRLVAQGQAWRRVETLLGAGRKLENIIASADELTLEAIREWAPVYVQAQTQPDPNKYDDQANWQEPDTTWITDQVVSRLAEVAQDPTPFKEALATVQEARAPQVWAKIMDRLESGNSMLGTEDLTELYQVDVDGYRQVVAPSLGERFPTSDPGYADGSTFATGADAAPGGEAA